MSLFKIALIKKNYDQRLNVMDNNILEESIKKNIEYFETNDLMKDVSEILNMDETSFADTEICYEYKDTIYQIIHFPLRNKDCSLDSFNQLGSMILSDQVHDDCVMVKFKVKNDKTCIEDNINEEDIKNVIMCHICPTVLKITHDGYTENTTFDEISKTKVHAPIDINCFGFNLIAWITINFEGEPINKSLTRIAGDKFVLGDAYVLQRFRSGYISFTEDDFKFLEQICWVPYKDRNIEQGEKTLNGKIKVFNRYTIIKDVKKKFKSYLEKENQDWDVFFKTIKTSQPENVLALERSMKGQALDIGTDMTDAEIDQKDLKNTNISQVEKDNK